MTTPTPIPVMRFRPQAEGLERWLGPLEAAIMTCCWQAAQPRTAKQILTYLRREYRRDTAYTTAVSTANKLWGKGLLMRDDAPRRGNVRIYRPNCSESEFVEIQVRAIHASLEAHK